MASCYGVSKLLLILLTTSFATALPATKPVSGQINSNSVLVALLDSHYTELAELVEKALLLQTLEEAVGRHNITIFAPRNDALERNLDPLFKSFLLEPRNLKSLQTLLMFHILPRRVSSPQWPSLSHHHRTLSNDHVHLTVDAPTLRLKVDSAEIIRPDDVIRPDGIIHGIERLLIPRSVQEDFNRRRSLRSISAVLPEGAPEVDPRTNRLKKHRLPSPPEPLRFSRYTPPCHQAHLSPRLQHPDPEVHVTTSTARLKSKTSSTLSCITVATTRWLTFSST